MILIFETNDEQFYLRKRISDFYYVSVTNMKFVWSCSFTKDEILQLFKSQNPLLRIPQDKSIQFIESLLSGSNLDTKIVKNEDRLFLTVSRKIPSNLKIGLTLELLVQNSDKFYEEVTLPLIALLNGLIVQRTQLCAMVKAKDVELNEYKLEGAKISRKNVETEDFKEDSFIQAGAESIIKKLRSNPDCTLFLSSDLSQILSDVSCSRESVDEVKTDLNNDHLDSSPDSKAKLLKRKKKLSANPSSSEDCETNTKANIGANVSRSKVLKSVFKL